MKLSLVPDQPNPAPLCVCVPLESVSLPATPVLPMSLAVSGTPESVVLSDALPAPIVYKIDLKVAPHFWTSSKVQPIDKDGGPAESFEVAIGRK